MNPKYNAWKIKIQTDKKFKITLFIRTKYDMLAPPKISDS